MSNEHLLSSGQPSVAPRQATGPSPTAALDARAARTPGTIDPEGMTPPTRRVRAVFIAAYALAYTGFWLAALSPVVISLALKVNSLVGSGQAAGTLGLVVAVGALLAMVASPVWGKLSDRTTSRFGMRRPWIVIGAFGGIAGGGIMAAATSVPVLLLGFCVNQIFLNAALAGLIGLVPDQVPVSQRGTVSGILGVSLPVGLVGGTFVVQLVAPNKALIFLLPVGIAAVFILLFAVVLKDRRLDPASTPAWSLREVASTFYVNPRKHPDFGWAWASRFLLVLAYAFLTTYQAFYLLNKLGSPQDEVAHQVFLATLVLSGITVISSLVGGRLSDVTGRRKVFVLAAAGIYGIALFIAATASEFNGFLIAMAVAGIGFGAYAAVDLALVTDVLPDPDNVAKDLGVFNIASTLPQSIAPAIAPIILAIASGSYAILFGVAGVAAVLSALAILPVEKVK